MRRLLIALLFVFASLPVAGVNTVVVMRHAAAGGAFCDGTFGVCEEFGGTLGSWTQKLGTATISGGQLVSPASGNGMLLITAATGGLTQYAIAKLVDWPASSNQLGVTLRYRSDDTQYHYVAVVEPSTNIVYWSTYDNTGGWKEDVQQCSLTFAKGNYVAAKVTGTSTATVFEVWKYTSAPTAAPSGTADCTFTNDPSVSFPADSGLLIGIAQENSATTKIYDDFAGGGS